MRRTPRRRYTPLVWALYLNAGLLAAVLLALVSRGAGLGSTALAAPPPGSQPIAGGNGLFLMPGQLYQNTWGCYVMDVERQTLCAYEYMPGSKQLRLVAARYFAHDRQLQNYNTSPAPDEIERLVQLQNQAVRGAAGDATKRDPALPNDQTPAGDVGPNPAGPAGPAAGDAKPGERPVNRPPQPGDPDYVPKPSDINNNPG